MFHGVIQKITLAQFFETGCISMNIIIAHCHSNFVSQTVIPGYLGTQTPIWPRACSVMAGHPKI